MDMEVDTQNIPRSNGWDFARAHRTKPGDWGNRTQKRVRDNRMVLRFNDYEFDLITALANYQGEQPATLLRQMIFREAEELLALGSNVETRSA